MNSLTINLHRAQTQPWKRLLGGGGAGYIQQWVAVAHAQDSLVITFKREKYRELFSSKSIERTSSKYLIFDVLSVLPRL